MAVTPGVSKSTPGSQSVAVDVDTIGDVLYGTTGITSWAAGAAPANGVSMSEALRYISEDQSLRIANKAAASLPQSTAGALFTIASGNILVVSLVGEVTTVIQTQANATKLTFNPTGTGASTDLCTSLDITADAVGTFYSLTGVAADALQDGVWMVPKMAQELILGPGTIDLDCAASNTGAVEWHLLYRKIDASAAVS